MFASTRSNLPLAISGAEIADARRIGLHARARCSRSMTSIWSETVPQSVPVEVAELGKYWSERQDLNRRSPRPERLDLSGMSLKTQRFCRRS